MLTLEQIRFQLEDRKLSMIAKRTGLHYQTVRKVINQQESKPDYDTCEKLSEYLEARMSK